MHPCEADIPSDNEPPSPPEGEGWAEEGPEDKEQDWGDSPLHAPKKAAPTWIEEEDDDDALDWGILVTVGWMELSAFPEWGVADVRTHCATHHEISSLHGELHQPAPGRVGLSLGKSLLDLPLITGTQDLVVELEILLSGVRFRTQLSLIATSGPPLLVLGRDALAGRFLVDPSRSWVGS